MLESKFKRKLKERILDAFPEAEVIYKDPSIDQGKPDLIILYKCFYAVLEVKRSEKAPYQPNQKYYISEYKKRTFSSVVYPENVDFVLMGLTEFFSFVDMFEIKRNYDSIKNVRGNDYEV